ncbi:hypothetical protein [Chryseobacterium shigense]|uniref:Quercetin dioxygenase-like cupin family protein n=1 Tax=Chryseobacterium shigense TaxID=297244 RepID=A0A841NKP7_9FLAO|nr:hypothetical protein [Chryseobacterium shigense]MBB6372632.1 quercetin dioxygenase-like cupin family protein [Chryseobacterium shigense]
MEQIDVKIGEIGTKVLFETEHVKVWDLTLAPGEATKWHKHQMDYMFVVVKNGKVATEYINGEIENQDDEIGIVDFRKKDIPHRLVNNDNQEYKNIVVEFKATFSED